MINNNSYTAADYLFDPLGVIHPIEGEKKIFDTTGRFMTVNPGDPSSMARVALVVAKISLKAIATLGAALLTVGTLFIPFSFYCYKVYKANQDNSTAQDTTALKTNQLVNTRVQVGQRKIPEQSVRTISSKKLIHLLEMSRNKLDGPIIVTGDVEINNRLLLKKLPDNLTIKGDLTLSDLEGKITLPANLTVEKQLGINDCTDLTIKAKAEDLKIPNIDIRKCEGEITLPANLTVHDALRINNCTDLTINAEKFKTSYLNINSSGGKITLPENLTRDIIRQTFKSCSDLTINSTALSTDIEICTNITFSNNLPNYLRIRNCAELTINSEAEDPKINTIDISGCEGEITLPDNLTVNDMLIESERPTDLTIKGDNLTIDFIDYGENIVIDQTTHNRTNVVSVRPF